MIFKAGRKFWWAHQDDVHDCRDAGGRAIREKIAEDARVSRSTGKCESDLEHVISGVKINLIKKE